MGPEDTHTYGAYDQDKRLEKKKKQRGNIFVTLFGAVALVGAVGATASGVMRGPMMTMAKVSQRAMAESQIIANTKLATMSVAHPTILADQDCDKDGTIEAIPWDAGTGPTGGGIFPASVPTSSASDPWETPYGYCVWDHGNEVDDAACGGAGQNRLPGLEPDAIGAGTVAGETVLTVISAGPDKIFQTTCNDWATADGNLDGDLDDVGDVTLVQTPANSDDLVMTFTYAEAEIATSSNWKVQDTTTDTAEITQDKVEVSGYADIGGALTLTSNGLLLAGDPGDDSITGACNVVNENALRRNTSTTPATLEICTGGAWTAISDGGGSAGGTNPPNDHIAHWTMDETSGTSITDSAGGFNGTLTGAAGVTSVTGQIGTALDFDGTDDFVNLGTDAGLKLSLPVTMSAWINFDVSGSNMGIFNNDKGGPGNTLTGISMMKDSSNRIQVQFARHTSGAPCTANLRSTKTGTTTLTAGQWYHVTGVIRGNSDMDIYIDGVDDGGSYTSTAAPNPAVPGYKAANAGAIGLEFRCSTGSDKFFDGKMDDIRFYDRALSASEAVALAAYEGSEHFASAITETKILASNGAAGHHFGSHMTSNDRYTLVSRFRTIYVFDTESGTELYSLSLSGSGSNEVCSDVDIDGTTGVAGCGFEDTLGSNAGSAWIFDVETGTELFKLTASDGAAGDAFGAGVAIGGNYVAVGATSAGPGDIGSVYVFDRYTGEELRIITPPSGKGFGTDVTIDGNILFIGDHEFSHTGLKSGTAFLYNVETGKELFRVHPSTVANGYQHGSHASAIEGNYLLIAASKGRDGDPACCAAGQVYVLDVRTGEHLRTLFPADVAVNDTFGRAIAVSGDIALIGSDGDDDQGSASGSAYIFNYVTGEELGKIVPSDGEAGDEFGIAVALNGSVAYISAWQDDDNGANAGAIYRYDGIPVVNSAGVGAALEEDFTTHQTITQSQNTVDVAGGTFGSVIMLDTDNVGDEAGIAMRIDNTLGDGELPQAVISAIRSGLGSETGLAFKVQSSSTLTTGMFIDGDGNIGINSTAPSDVKAKLQVGNASEWAEQGLTDGLLHYWNFDEGSGTTLYDKIGGRHGTLTNFDATPSWTSDGVFGGALEFDGIDDNIPLGGEGLGSTFDNNRLTAYSISAWIKGKGGSPTGAVFHRGGAHVGSYNPLLTADGAYEDGVLTSLIGTPFSDGEWHHYVVTHDGATIRFYIDGALNASANVIPGTMPSIGIACIGSYGAGNCSSFSGFFYNGFIDEMRVYNKTLNEEEIQELLHEQYYRRGLLVTSENNQTYQGKLTALDGEADDQFGYAVATEGDYAVISAPFDDDNGVDSGSAYVFDINTGTQLFKLTASDGAAGDLFGFDVAISGTIAIIGAPLDDDSSTDTGSAYVFDVTTGDELRKLNASDASNLDLFGAGLDIAGDIAVIGATHDDDVGSNSGSAYVFDVTTGNELRKLLPVPIGTLGKFGSKISIDGDRVAIGAPFDSGLGAVHVLDINTGTQISRATGTIGNGYLGISIGFGNGLVSAGWEVHTRARAFDAETGTELHEIRSFATSNADEWGYSLAQLGDIAVIGAPTNDDRQTDGGSASLYNVRNNTQLIKLYADDAQTDDRFGHSVGLSDKIIIIGAPENDATASNAGAIYIFPRNAPRLFAGKEGDGTAIIASTDLTFQDVDTDGTNPAPVATLRSDGTLRLEEAIVVLEGSADAVHATNYLSGTASTSPLRLSRARGTEAAPTTIADGDVIAGLSFGAYNGSMHALGSAGIYAKVNGAVSTGNVPTDLFFTSDPTGAFTTPNMTLSSSGSLGIGTTAPSATVHVTDRITLDDGLRIGSESICAIADAGTMRLNGGIYEYCSGSDWLPLLDNSPSVTPSIYIGLAWGEQTGNKLGDGGFVPSDALIPNPIVNIPLYKIDSHDEASCGLSIDGKGWCWGTETVGKFGNGGTTSDSSNIPSQVSTITDFIDIGIGNDHACGLRSNGEAYCWGDDSFGQLGNGAITGTQLTPVQVSTITDFVSISAGQSHNCGIDSTGAAYCWGRCDNGRCGDNDTSAHNVTAPVLVQGGHTWSSIWAGVTHSCGVTTIGTGYCWGGSSAVELGHGYDDAPHGLPQQVLHIDRFENISAGRLHTMAVDTAGVAYTWGNHGGVSGAGSATFQRYGPATLFSGPGVIQMRSNEDNNINENHSCYLTEAGLITCWGQNSFGQLGDGTTTTQTNPGTSLSIPAFASDVSVGTHFATAVITNKDGNLTPAMGWGKDSANQVGNDTLTNDITSPNLVYGQYDFVQIDGGGSHSCGITNNGDAYCWGFCSDGICGDNDVSSHSNDNPILVEGGHHWRHISAGTNHTCGLTTEGDAYCWGRDASGQLGNGATAGNQGLPQIVDGNRKWMHISAGRDHSCGVVANNNAEGYCWGENSDSRLGDGGTTDSDVPVLVSGSHFWSRIEAGLTHSCGLTTEGDAYCWGDDTNKSLGNGAAENSKTTPFAVTGSHQFRDIAVYDTVCGIDFDGNLYCWGFNSFGEAGLGDSSSREDPTLVNVAWIWKDVDVGEKHACALNSAGKAYCWGNDSDGQLGNGTLFHNDEPDAVDTVYLFSSISVGSEHSLAIIDPGTENTPPTNTCHAGFLPNDLKFYNSALNTLYTTLDIPIRGFEKECMMTLASESTEAYIELDTGGGFNNVGTFTPVSNGDVVRFVIRSHVTDYDTNLKTYVTVGSQRRVIDVETFPSKTVFITAATHSALMPLSHDAICQMAAADAGLEGHYRSWVNTSNHTNDEVRDRFVQSDYEYALVDGTIIANDWSDLTDGTLDNAINIDEYGNNVASARVWTNVTTAGGIKGLSCTEWQDTSAGDTGNYGMNNATDSTWTDSGSATCDNNYHIYCFEQF